MRILLAFVGCFVFLVLMNGALFPLLWPEGPPIEYANARAEPLVGLHMLGITASALCLTLVFAFFGRGLTLAQGLALGLLLGLLISLPSAFHTHALVPAPLGARLGPGLWTTALTSLAGGLLTFLLGARALVRAGAEPATPSLG